MRKFYLAFTILLLLTSGKLIAQTSFEDSLSKFPFTETQYYRILYKEKSLFVFNFVPATAIANRVDSLNKVSENLAKRIYEKLPSIKPQLVLFIIFTPQYYIFRSENVAWMFSLKNFMGKGQKTGFPSMVDPGYLSSEMLTRLLKFPLEKNQSIEVTRNNNLTEIHILTITSELKVANSASLSKAKLLAGSIYNKVIYPECSTPVAIRIIGRANNRDYYSIERTFMVDSCLLSDLNEQDQFKERLKKYHWLPDQYFSMDSVDDNEIKLISLVDSPMAYSSKQTMPEIRRLITQISGAFTYSTFLDYSKFTIVYADRHATPYSTSVYWEFKLDKYGIIDFLTRYVVKGTVDTPMIPVPNISLTQKLAFYPLLPNQYLFYWPLDTAKQEIHLINIMDGDCPTKLLEDEIKIRVMAFDLFSYLTPQESKQIKYFVIEYRDRLQCYPTSFYKIDFYDGALKLNN